MNSDNFKTIEGDEVLIVEAQRKTGKRFSIVLNDSIILAIQDYNAKKPYSNSKNALFINPTTKMTYSVAWVTKRFRELREKEPVLMGRKFSTHSLRKTHATQYTSTIEMTSSVQGKYYNTKAFWSPNAIWSLHHARRNKLVEK